MNGLFTTLSKLMELQKVHQQDEGMKDCASEAG